MHREHINICITYLDGLVMEISFNLYLFILDEEEIDFVVAYL